MQVIDGAVKTALRTIGRAENFVRRNKLKEYPKIFVFQSNGMRLYLLFEPSLDAIVMKNMTTRRARYIGTVRDTCTTYRTLDAHVNKILKKRTKVD